MIQLFEKCVWPGCLVARQLRWRAGVGSGKKESLLNEKNRFSTSSIEVEVSKQPYGQGLGRFLAHFVKLTRHKLFSCAEKLQRESETIKANAFAFPVSFPFAMSQKSLRLSKKGVFKISGKSRFFSFLMNFFPL
jgi:hypothetical protein